MRAVVRSFVFVAIAGLICQCGSHQPLRANPGPSLHLVFWQYPMPGQEEFYRDLARAFQSSHPGIRLDIALRPWTEAHESIARWCRTRTGPDLTIVPDVWLAEFAPWLDRYPDEFRRSFLDKFVPVMLRRSQMPGGNPGFVWAASTKALFYRTDLFRARRVRPPATWDELVSRAVALNRPPGLYGLPMPGAPELDTADSFYLLLWSNGGDLFDDTGKVTIDSPEGVEALRFYRDLVLRYHVTEPNFTRCAKSCAESLFGDGHAAMIETGPWAISAFRSSAAHPAFSVAPLPRGTRQVTQLVTDHLVLFRTTQLRATALEFVRFAYQTAWRQRWARLGMVPELKQVAADSFFKTDPNWSVFIAQLPNAHWIPMMKWEPMDRAIREMLVDVSSGRMQPRAALLRLAPKLARLASTR